MASGGTAYVFFFHERYACVKSIKIIVKNDLEHSFLKFRFAMLDFCKKEH